jgi:hypothetical protein
VPFVCVSRVGLNGERGAASSIPTFDVNLELEAPIRQKLTKMKDVMNGRECYGTFCGLTSVEG